MFSLEANSCVINAGNMTDYVNRGVRQGCPLSPNLFILCIETLSATVLEARYITGIKINEKIFKTRRSRLMQHSQ